MKLVYIAGPLGAESEWDANVREACRAGKIVADLGLAVHVPHCAVEWHRHFPEDYETWIERDLAVVRRCDVLVRLPGVSPGADREVGCFLERGYSPTTTRLITLEECWTTAGLTRAVVQAVVS